METITWNSACSNSREALMNICNKSIIDNITNVITKCYSNLFYPLLDNIVRETKNISKKVSNFYNEDPLNKNLQKYDICNFDYKRKGKLIKGKGIFKCATDCK